MTQKDDMLTMVSAMEQAETALPDIARLIGIFYTSLIKHGVPEDLARQLVSDWYWSVILQQQEEEEEE